jgi:hypothetical protein
MWLVGLIGKGAVTFAVDRSAIGLIRAYGWQVDAGKSLYGILKTKNLFAGSV